MYDLYVWYNKLCLVEDMYVDDLVEEVYENCDYNLGDDGSLCIRTSDGKLTYIHNYDCFDAVAL